MDQPLAVAVQEAIVSAAAGAFGQDVLQQQPEKADAGQGPCLGGGATLGVAEGDLAVFAGEDVLWRYRPCAYARHRRWGLEGSRRTPGSASRSAKYARSSSAVKSSGQRSEYFAVRRIARDYASCVVLAFP